MKVIVGHGDHISGSLTLEADGTITAAGESPDETRGLQRLVQQLHDADDPPDRFLGRLPLRIRNGYMWAVMDGMDWTTYLDWMVERYPALPSDIKG